MIITVTRCLNEEKNIERFLKGYDFSDVIIVSDGGSTDKSIEMLTGRDKVKLLHFDQFEIQNGQRWNPDAPHMNFIINAAKEYDPAWIILDDMDDVPNYLLRDNARSILDTCDKPQVNAFRLYLWGNTGKYFPKMNGYFNGKYKSLWAWSPRQIEICADETIRHGTILGITEDNFGIDLPNCLLHKSWHPETIDAKVNRYNDLGLPMQSPLLFAGEMEELPDFAVE